MEKWCVVLFRWILSSSVSSFSYYFVVIFEHLQLLPNIKNHCILILHDVHHPIKLLVLFQECWKMKVVEDFFLCFTTLFAWSRFSVSDYIKRLERYNQICHGNKIPKPYSLRIRVARLLRYHCKILSPMIVHLFSFLFRLFYDIIHSEICCPNFL